MRSVAILCKSDDTVQELWNRTKAQVNSISNESNNCFCCISFNNLDLYFVESSKYYSLIEIIRKHGTEILGELLDTEYDELLKGVETEKQKKSDKCEKLKCCLPVYHEPVTRESWESAIDDVIVPAYYTCGRCGKKIGSFGGWGSNLTKYYSDKCPDCDSNILWEFV